MLGGPPFAAAGALSGVALLSICSKLGSGDGTTGGAAGANIVGGGPAGAEAAGALSGDAWLSICSKLGSGESTAGAAGANIVGGGAAVVGASPTVTPYTSRSERRPDMSQVFDDSSK